MEGSFKIAALPIRLKTKNLLGRLIGHRNFCKEEVACSSSFPKRLWQDFWV
jgi:hypothetical protein